MSYLYLASFAEIASYVGNILLAILILLIMISVHEAGHYLAGKIFHFGIEEFAIGFGPKIFKKKKKNGEIFSIRAFPIGGFCSFRGEDEDDKDPSAFNNKKWWQRIIVLVSGALMNYITAIFIIMLMFGIYGQTTIMTYKVAPTTEIASEYCFQERDIILSANGKNVFLTLDLMSAIEGKEKGDKVDFVVRRDGVDKNIQIQLREDAHFKNLEDMQGLYSALGIYYETDENGLMVNGGLYSTGVRFGFFQTIGRSFEYSFLLVGSVFSVLGQLFSGALGINSLGGTITTITVAAEAIQFGGFINFLNIASFIGVNLAVFNLLPIPALDGARAVFTAIEGITKKPIPRRIEGIIHTVGLVLILAFAIFIDLQQCF